MKLVGWRATGASLLAGALAALAMPPLYWLPLAVIGIAAFVWLWQTAPSPRAAFVRGLAWGTGHFAVGSYWIVEAFLVPPADYAALGVPIVTGLALVLGFFPGLAAGVAKWLVGRWPRLGGHESRGRYRRVLVLALAWTAAEWLRGHVFTGYPWNPLAHVWAFATPLLQGAAVVGAYGLGLLSFLVLAAPVVGWRASIGALVALGLAGLAGQWVMVPLPDAGPMLRIVQPNTPQAEKFRPQLAAQQFAKLVELSRQPGFDNLAAVIWPETAPPLVIEPGGEALAIMARAVPPNGVLLTGAARTTNRPREDGVWNSLLVVDRAGAITATYDKVHLVPLGEYIPFRRQLAPVSGMIGRGSFEEGDSRVTLALEGLPPFSPVICYEVIFPGAVTGPGARPRWLLNITNDAWFGVSSGPFQHLTSARLRSIEEGLPMFRAANTGISAVIDAYGQVVVSLGMEQTGVLDHKLPGARETTPYGRWGDWATLALGLLLASGLFIRQK